jgi:predicted metal-dependent TIM-barrel fold hydrolase
MTHQQLVFVDSHVHLDHILEKHPGHVQWMREMGCLPISWSWAARVKDAQGLAAYLTTLMASMDKARDEGLPCYYLAGIHPRNITPDLTPAMVPDLLVPHLESPLCLGIGEIGLETASAREKEIFEAQLEMGKEAARLGKVVGVHTPRQDKDRVLEETLPLLRKSGIPPENIVVDHLTAGTLPKVLNAGFYAGITLNPSKTTLEELPGILARHAGDEEAQGRMMLNTDSGLEVHFTLQEFTQEQGVDAGLRARVSRDNTLAFYNLFL